MKSAAILLLTFLSFTLSAQTTSRNISGTVKDTQNETIPGATVKLLKASDSTMILGEITNSDGKFQFNKLPNGAYLLAITAMGQKPFMSTILTLDDARTTLVLPIIVLLPAKNIELKEVVVKAKRPLIEQDIDKTVVNVGSMSSSATSNALEVLEKTPGVTVGMNGEISLNGKSGILVLIDGRATYMSGQDLAAMGGLTEEQIRNAKIILWNGYCSVHQVFKPEQIDNFLVRYPETKVIAHPEACFEVCQKADYVGSTEYILKTVREAEPNTRWLVATELNLVNRLHEECKAQGKNVHFMSPTLCMCSTMFRTDPQHLAWSDGKSGSWASD